MQLWLNSVPYAKPKVPIIQTGRFIRINEMPQSKRLSNSLAHEKKETGKEVTLRG
jgi:hypothetical protein